MKVTYDPRLDTVRILFSNAPIERSVAEIPGTVVDYDDRGDIVGLELAEASRRIHDPRTVHFVERESETEHTEGVTLGGA